MNKKTKGAIAAGAAAALLAGGAGSFALWSDSETLNGGTITAGTLTLTAQGSPSWSDENGAIDISTFRAVPGDVLTYKAQAVVGATGDNLEAAITVDPASITGDLAASLGTPVVSMEIAGSPVSTITDDNNNEVVDVEVAFTFAQGAGNATQTKTASLANMTLTLQQQ
ncbi:alternate-type signal peptide domain-containing protein [Prescottella equi]|uniref:Alternate-type signal peptide domain-containing protein n=2 Tax=Rhodococcus hoagii TaxID=43767 RepID=A0A9Q2XXC6_RHOHA|nr:alternate-type signal peptide domain-containing protein [Prescottella equi]MBM4487289.1 alternate-type signal peptide domain-containing protein [Prescottella equi]MBM4487646.1 alternate-type signal peptide domain-containing protein [Prescottella equi]MBM4500599.1 alternate-type signal peptide domain-containing protein [Prescottella equi]MBM4508057.1 alternate-type signal peptide domain-containing protein [Prescottella equi]MBM4510166.1 alternate-type signal peptide domain-containing protein